VIPRSSGQTGRLLALTAVLLLAPLQAARLAAQPACLTPEQAQAHVGERACVEGVVTGAVFAQRSTGQPTFLDLGPRFTAVIWIEDRPKFNPPPETLRGRRVRVSGRIETFRGKAQIVVRDPDQLVLAGAAAPSAPLSSSPVPVSAAPTLTPQPSAAPPATPTAVAPAGQARVREAAPAPAATAPPEADGTNAEPRDGGTVTPLVAAGAGLLALGGGLAAWQRLRRRPPAG
jgi:hypothetical protein